MRESKTTDFVADVEGVGQFVFGRRGMRDEIRCSVELRRLTEGVPVDGETLVFLRAIADLRVMTVAAPPGWNPEELDDLDPFEDTAYANVLKCWEALRDKEETFRVARKAEPQGGGGASGDV
jgi:hypothetical protein